MMLQIEKYYSARKPYHKLKNETDPLAPLYASASPNEQRIGAKTSVTAARHFEI